MENITFRCENPACKKTLKVKAALVGKRIMCPKCEHKMRVPAQAAPPLAPPPLNMPPKPPPAPLPAVGEPASVAPTLFKATKQSYGLFCPKCGGLLLPPQMELKGIVCHHCGAQIEFV
jgi:hypothetical protein